MSSSAGLAPRILSQLDPPEIGEGSVDPLTARLAAGLRAPGGADAAEADGQKQRVRFLTTVPAGVNVCECFEPDAIAADEPIESLERKR